MLKVIELFSGVGAQAKAFERLQRDYDFKFETTATSDIDKDAILSYAAIHCGLTTEMIDNYEYPERSEMVKYLSKLNIGYDFKQNKPYDWAKLARRKGNLINKYYLATVISKQVGDISKAEKLPKSDMWIYSFPCTDISSAGLQKGFSKDSNSRSSLVWQVLRLLNVSQKNGELPSILLMENVLALVSNKFINDFYEWTNALEQLGYKTYWKVLNAKDYGVPQNRERVFAISFLDGREYEFPKTFPLRICLKDILQHNVAEKYYLSDKISEKLIKQIMENDASNAVRVGGRASVDRHAWDIVVETPTYLAYYNQSENFTRPPMKEQARSLKANKSDVCVIEPNVSKSIGIVVEHNGTDFQKFAEVSTFLQARDYKGFNNYGQTEVIEMMNNIVEIGNLYELGEKGYNRMNGAVVSVIGVSPTLRTGNSGGHNELKVLEEPCICASRGRNPENPSDRTAGVDLEQRIEVNQAETSNALTTVHKDNLVIEPVMLTPKRNEYGKSIRKEYENGDIAESRHNMTDLIPKLESTSNTLTSVQKDNLLIEPTIIQNAHGFNKDGEFELSPAITRSDFENNNFVKQPRYRVRKLTPLECLRLMDFDDEDFKKIKDVGVSDSQIYKQCGNSIVVSCLYCIFYKAFINTEITEDKQISFFDQFTE